jgi:hypothetical protein
VKVDTPLFAWMQLFVVIMSTGLCRYMQKGTEL